MSGKLGTLLIIRDHVDWIGNSYDRKKIILSIRLKTEGGGRRNAECCHLYKKTYPTLQVADQT